VTFPWDVATRLAAGDALAVEEAISYLEHDPWEFRSGYAKATLLRRLKHIELAEVDKIRLDGVLIRYVDIGARWDFEEACTLARRLNRDTIRSALRSRLHAADVSVALRALTMLLRLRHAHLSAADIDRARTVLVEWAARGGYLERHFAGRVRRLWSPQWGRALVALADSLDDSSTASGARRLLRTVPNLARRTREADPKR
jgi:hypothetical protein